MAVELDCLLLAGSYLHHFAQKIGTSKSMNEFANLNIFQISDNKRPDCTLKKFIPSVLALMV